MACEKKKEAVGSRGLKRDGGKYSSLSRSLDLAKLYPKCHMNYSISFTEISFYPETSNFTWLLNAWKGYSMDGLFHKITKLCLKKKQ